MRSVKSGYHSNVAIVDLLPGGFEVVIEKSRPAVEQNQADTSRSQRHEQEESEVEEGEGRS